MAQPLQRTNGGAPVTLEDDTLARVIAQARADHTSTALQRLVRHQGWKDGYIAMRDWGEVVRTGALSLMGLSGRDPREGGISASLMIRYAAAWLQLGYWEAPEVHAAVIQGQRRDLVLCWIMFYPARRQPYLVVRAQHRGPSSWFRAACLLGYYSRMRNQYSGDMPAQPLLGHVGDVLEATWTHAFAKALLCLSPRCLDDYSCCCNDTLRAIHDRAPDWAQPTGELNARRLQNEVRRQSGIPYAPPQPQPRPPAAPSRPLAEDSQKPWRVVRDVDPDDLDDDGRRWDDDDDPPTEPVGPRSRP